MELANQVPSFSLELLRDKTDNIDVKADFFENQTFINNEIINKLELKSMELPKEEQEFTEKLEERAEAKKHKKNDETFTKINGFYNCPECSYKTQWNKSNLKVHIDAIHREVKPYICSDCSKGFTTIYKLSQHRLCMHNTNKSWICDCCGLRFGCKDVLRKHMMIHLPPTFTCSVCDKKFVHAGNLIAHKKLHRGILNEICEVCNKEYATKVSLSHHKIQRHFAKFHCEVTGCSSVSCSKSYYKFHLKTMHKKEDQVMIKDLIINLEKLKPNYQQLKYV